MPSSDHRCFHVDGVFAFGEECKAPAYCHECGNPYPWTEQNVAARELIDLMEISKAEKAALKDDLPNLVAGIRQLTVLQELAQITWPADPASRQLWGDDDLDFIRTCYTEQVTDLVEVDPNANGIDPFMLRQSFVEQSMGPCLDRFFYCMYIVVRAAVIDFMNDVLDSARFPGLRGSMRCTECGQFVPRRSTGYGQLYCAELCKKRAAKRRNRARAKLKNQSLH